MLGDSKAEGTQAGCFLCASYQFSSHLQKLPFATKFCKCACRVVAWVDARLLSTAGGFPMILREQGN